MTKTKLQIMREKKGLTVEQLAYEVNRLEEIRRNLPKGHGIIDIEGLILSFNRIENNDFTFSAIYTKKSLIIKVIAQSLGCSVDELVEE
ncbi:XRE family transcriptional regulator [Lactococcus garvieae]|uniref:XRE family transcriptional regulator n=1 Tax=Lactococcus garvieae TaxID=1363 RepID=UPI00254C033D|nr:XRE family transcriptional regulator [Lactococcus garvieae]